MIQEQIAKLKSDKNFSLPAGLSIEAVEAQIKLFESGVKIPKLEKPCTVNDGIVKINPAEIDDLLNLHSLAASESRLMKFVPASGAASRMFQKLLSVLNENHKLNLTSILERLENDKTYKSVYDVLINLNRFAFYDDLKDALEVDDTRINDLVSSQPEKILRAILFESGLNYSSKPKGAIKFHKYLNESRTAFEEQIYESFHYVVDKEKRVKIHFTISEEHESLFIEIIEQTKKRLKNDFRFDISYSFQKKTTDTIAVDENNNILFDKHNKIIARPAGHGALIENLNDLKADLVIIKNIDNLSTERLAEDTCTYKKLLTGYLIKLQNQIHEYIRLLESKNQENIDLNEIVDFCKEKLFILTPSGFDDFSLKERIAYLNKKLNRPVRVCGMVKNEGEPGGGPFWVKSEDGRLSLQIIEQAQINLNDEQQKNIFKGSTHFNPVDLVCGLRDYKGDNFDLHNFIDHQSGIITKKSKDGVHLKALELPGLWNGAMSDWITVFLEVPISTFNPVKEINDLLRKEHQN